jgi:hypothetical protein
MTTATHVDGDAEPCVLARDQRGHPEHLVDVDLAQELVRRGQRWQRVRNPALEQLPQLVRLLRAQQAEADHETEHVLQDVGLRGDLELGVGPGFDRLPYARGTLEFGGRGGGHGELLCLVWPGDSDRETKFGDAVSVVNET